MRSDDVQPDRREPRRTVGVPLPGVRVSIADDRELIDEMYAEETIRA